MSVTRENVTREKLNNSLVEVLKVLQGLEAATLSADLVPRIPAFERAINLMQKKAKGKEDEAVPADVIDDAAAAIALVNKYFGKKEEVQAVLATANENISQALKNVGEFSAAVSMSHGAAPGAGGPEASAASASAAAAAEPLASAVAGPTVVALVSDLKELPAIQKFFNGGNLSQEAVEGLWKNSIDFRGEQQKKHDAIETVINDMFKVIVDRYINLCTSFIENKNKEDSKKEQKDVKHKVHRKEETEMLRAALMEVIALLESDASLQQKFQAAQTVSEKIDRASKNIAIKDVDSSSEVTAETLQTAPSKFQEKVASAEAKIRERTLIGGLFHKDKVSISSIFKPFDMEKGLHKGLLTQWNSLRLAFDAELASKQKVGVSPKGGMGSR